MDIVVDTDCYVQKANPVFKRLFGWLRSQGTLTVSQKLITEYFRTDNRFIATLLNHLIREDRLIRVRTQELKAFKQDKHYKYTCNGQDRWHARLVFLSHGKRLVSLDNRLVNDVNKFKKVDGVKPRACRYPKRQFYES